MKKKNLIYALLMALGIGCMLPQVVMAVESAGSRKSAPEIYELDAMNVEADAKRKKSIVNPYITGGDVTVITREDIEKHHYTNIEDAIKKIPGVQISTPGYRGGEYGYNSFNTEVSVNGDNGVIILIDGRRIDNDAMSYAGNKSKVNLSTITGIENVERIEVIKGPGSTIYGADATGGVINIITRKGKRKPITTLDMSSGSWGRHNYSLAHSGSSDGGTLKYNFALGRQLSKDSKYKDYYAGDTKQYYNTGFRDEYGSFAIGKDFDKNHSLNFSFNHTYEKAHYPITAPDYKNMSYFLESKLGMSSSDPGYRNWFLYDAWLGSYNESKSNDIDLKYTFSKQAGMESFIRVYKNYRWYNTADYSNLFGTQYGDITPDMWNNAKASGNLHTDTETVTGTALQISKQVDKHNITSGVDYRHSEYRGTDNNSSNRDSYRLFAQDKMDISNKFTLTPGIHYNHYNKAVYTSNGSSVEGAGSNKLTFSAFSEYRFDQSGDIYFSWAQIFRPVSGYDYVRANDSDTLRDEEGTSWTIGVHKALSDKDAINISYGITDMDNALARYSVRNAADTKWISRTVNATRKKKALNMGITHEFSKMWKLNTSYTYAYENAHVKSLSQNPADTNAEALINALRPRNTYQTDLMYEKDKWSGDLSYTVYSGCSQAYFSDKRFNVLDLAVNYAINKQTKVYLNVNNITNESYENRAIAVYGPGALPQPGRNFMFGVKYTF